MTVETIQSEIRKMDAGERKEIMEFLQDLEDELRLQRSIEDVKNGRTTPAEVVFKELRERAIS